MAENRGWANEATAEAYAQFCRKHEMYSRTSADLVELASIGGDERVIDLACGTGQTTEVILASLGPGGTIDAVDSSAAMLAVARREVGDERVRWHLSAAENVADVATGADAVVCNSAIWQTDMPAAFRSVHAALRPGGRFVCNIGQQFLLMPPPEDELKTTSASLFDLMHAAAVLEQGHVPRPPVRRGGAPLTVDLVSEMLRAEGFEVEDTPELRYQDTVERQRDWLAIPIFTELTFPDLSYEQRLAALETAYDRVDRSQGRVSRWVAFLALRR